MPFNERHVRNPRPIGVPGSTLQNPEMDELPYDDEEAQRAYYEKEGTDELTTTDVFQGDRLSCLHPMRSCPRRSGFQR